MVIVITRADLKLKRWRAFSIVSQPSKFTFHPPNWQQRKNLNFGVEDLGYIPAT